MTTQNTRMQLGALDAERAAHEETKLDWHNACDVGRRLEVRLNQALAALEEMTDLRDRAVAEGHRLGAHAVSIMVDHVDPLKRELRETRARLNTAIEGLRLVAESYDCFRGCVDVDDVILLKLRCSIVNLLSTLADGSEPFTKGPT